MDYGVTTRALLACAAISIGFRAAMSSGRSAASNMLEVYQTGPYFAVAIYRPKHHAASNRWHQAIFDAPPGEGVFLQPLVGHDQSPVVPADQLQARAFV
jgi:hypothetical protein